MVVSRVETKHEDRFCAATVLLSEREIRSLKQLHANSCVSLLYEALLFVQRHYRRHWKNVAVCLNATSFLLSQF